MNFRLIRRIIILSLIFVQVANGVDLFSQTADAILGEWFAPDKDGKFLFYKDKGKYYGKLIWIKETKDEQGNLKVDKKNPDPAKRNNPMVGTVIFSDFKWDSEELKWVDGKVYDARSGDTWSCEIRLPSNLVLEVRGYLVFSWLGKSAYFTRY